MDESLCRMIRVPAFPMIPAAIPLLRDIPLTGGGSVVVVVPVGGVPEPTERAGKLAVDSVKRDNPYSDKSERRAVL